VTNDSKSFIGLLNVKENDSVWRYLMLYLGCILWIPMNIVHRNLQYVLNAVYIVDKHVLYITDADTMCKHNKSPQFST
jgi:hypothetical protein